MRYTEGIRAIAWFGTIVDAGSAAVGSYDAFGDSRYAPAVIESTVAGATFDGAVYVAICPQSSLIRLPMFSMFRNRSSAVFPNLISCLMFSEKMFTQSDSHELRVTIEPRYAFRQSSLLMNVLEPGRYTLECTAEGFRKEEVSFTIESGKTRDLELSLTPE